MRKVAVVVILAVALLAAYYILTYQAPPAGPASSEGVATKASPGEAAEGAGEQPADGADRVRLVTWNLLNFGGSKDEQEVAFIASLLRDFDVVAMQEVITSPKGAQAVARLDAQLDRSGAQWDYVVSDPTTGQGSERYAFLWKPSRVRLAGRPWLEPSLADALDREPYLARFETPQGRRMLVASFHAVPTAKKPADEIAWLDQLHQRYPDDHLLILGDFNLSEQHDAFDALKAAGYRPAIVDQKTSIRMRRKDGQHLANEYDNIFYEAAPLRVEAAGVIDFTDAFRTLRDARKISDHLPVSVDVLWN